MAQFPDTCFGYADLMLENLLGPNNKNCDALVNLVSHEDWVDTRRGIAANLVAAFEERVKSQDHFKRVKKLRELTAAISIFIAHSERVGKCTPYMTNDILP